MRFVKNNFISNVMIFRNIFSHGTAKASEIHAIFKNVFNVWNIQEIRILRQNFSCSIWRRKMFALSLFPVRKCVFCIRIIFQHLSSIFSPSRSKSSDDFSDKKTELHTKYRVIRDKLRTQPKVLYKLHLDNLISDFVLFWNVVYIPYARKI